MAYEKNPDELGALWAKESSKGPYLTGEINGVKVVCFRNDRKTGKQPDWRVKNPGMKGFLRAEAANRLYCVTLRDGDKLVGYNIGFGYPAYSQANYPRSGLARYRVNTGTGGTPVNTRAGKVRKLPPPAMAFNTPAPNAATASSSQVMRSPTDRCGWSPAQNAGPAAGLWPARHGSALGCRWTPCDWRC